MFLFNGWRGEGLGLVEADDLDLIISGEGVTGVLREGLILDILGSVGL